MGTDRSGPGRRRPGRNRPGHRRQRARHRPRRPQCRRGRTHQHPRRRGHDPGNRTERIEHIRGPRRLFSGWWRGARGCRQVHGGALLLGPLKCGWTVWKIIPRVSVSSGSRRDGRRPHGLHGPRRPHGPRGGAAPCTPSCRSRSPGPRRGPRRGRSGDDGSGDHHSRPRSPTDPASHALTRTRNNLPGSRNTVVQPHASGPSGSVASRHVRRRPTMQDGRWCGALGCRRRGPRDRHLTRENVT